MANKLQLLRGPQANIDALTLDFGQPAFTDAGKLYIGNEDGTTKTLINGLSGIPFGKVSISHPVSNFNFAVTVTDDFQLTEGALIIVMFNSSLTVTGPMTLNVNGTGAKNVMYRGADMPHFYIDTPYIFVYSTNQWNLSGELDEDTTYSTMTATTIKAGTDTIARVVSPKVLNDWLKSGGNTVLGSAAYADTGTSSGKIPVLDKIGRASCRERV